MPLAHKKVRFELWLL